MSSAIGIFDSGVGGFTVARQIIAKMPNKSILYLGDTARVPYGNRGKETIIRYTLECVGFLVSEGVRSVVIACNTASAISMSTLKDAFNVRIVGVIDAGSRLAVSTTKTGRVGVIATRGTIESGAYKSTITQMEPSVSVDQLATPLLVPLIEENFYCHKATRLIIKEYIDDFVKNIDTLILGCTHYPVIAGVISDMYPHLNVVDPAVEVAIEVQSLLGDKYALKDEEKPFYRFCVTDNKDKALQTAKTILRDSYINIDSMEEIKL